MSFFLRARSWQLFALHLGVPILVVAAFPPFDEYLATVGILAVTFYLGTYVLWLTSVTRACNQKLPRQFRRNTLWTEAGMALLTAFIFASLILANPFSDAAQFYPLQPPSSLAPYLTMLEYLSDVLYLAFVYAQWLCARQLTILKNGRKSLGGTIGRFLLIYMFPVGIWFLQPLVRQLTQPAAAPNAPPSPAT
ncbi:MAG: hypothetical protein OSA97_16995 [Nevskia sp.]|nr:hypothetical protein [Nevskia sp.]